MPHRFIRRAIERLRGPQFGPELVQLATAIDEKLQELKLQMGRLLVYQMRAAQPRTTREAEFKVFSQSGEDGILQYLVWKLGPMPETFVEFGVEGYTEANTLFLLLNNNWSGLVMDGSAAAMSSLRNRDLFWRHDLRAVAAFVDRDNINGLIETNGVSGEIGVLSIDIDGNDYWVWERIEVVQPVIVSAEYNSLFGARRGVAVPYDPRFERARAHFSTLYWGCSLKALCQLAGRKGYVFVGSNSAGNNAFFVRADRQRDLAAVTPEQGYVTSRFRESRDQLGKMTFLSGASRLEPIAHLPLIDVETGQTISVREAAGEA